MRAGQFKPIVSCDDFFDLELNVPLVLVFVKWNQYRRLISDAKPGRFQGLICRTGDVNAGPQQTLNMSDPERKHQGRLSRIGRGSHDDL